MNFVNKRGHFRVEILVPVKWQVLNEEETEKVKNGTGSSLFRQEGLPGPIEEFLEQASPGSKEEQLYRSLQLLNNKLDFIIDQLLSRSIDGTLNRDDIIEISASGLKLRTTENIDIGAFLKINLIMPGTFQYQLELIVEVLRIEERSDGFIIAARIICIDDDAQDSIVKTVFQKQRMDIRRLKSSQEDNNGG
ncbi:MAG: PilZ domain-containing protein [Deltaproteobacteria bacterium]|nr:PilZ domain-containing protein [Deltaproteobacteria bacterium]